MTSTPRRTFLLVGLLLAVALVPGCATPEPDADGGGKAGYTVSGTFTRNATQEQMNELGNHTRDRGGQMVLMESFPVQFRASNLTASACEEVRAFAEARDYVADVGPCEAA